MERRGFTFETDAYMVGEHLIWGATARIIEHLLERLSEADRTGPRSPSRRPLAAPEPQAGVGPASAVLSLRASSRRGPSRCPGHRDRLRTTADAPSAATCRRRPSSCAPSSASQRPPAATGRSAPPGASAGRPSGRRRTRRRRRRAARASAPAPSGSARIGAHERDQRVDQARPARMSSTMFMSLSASWALTAANCWPGKRADGGVQAGHVALQLGVSVLGGDLVTDLLHEAMPLAVKLSPYQGRNTATASRIAAERRDQQAVSGAFRSHGNASAHRTRFTLRSVKHSARAPRSGGLSSECDRGKDLSRPLLPLGGVGAQEARRYRRSLPPGPAPSCSPSAARPCDPRGAGGLIDDPAHGRVDGLGQEELQAGRRAAPAAPPRARRRWPAASRERATPSSAPRSVASRSGVPIQPRRRPASIAARRPPCGW